MGGGTGILGTMYFIVTGAVFLPISPRLCFLFLPPTLRLSFELFLLGLCRPGTLRM